MSTEWLQLFRLRGLSLAAKRKLVEKLGTPEAVLASKPTQLGELLGDDASRGIRLPLKPAPDKAAADSQALASCGGAFIDFTHPDFPPLLNQIAGAPLGVFVLGDAALLRSPQLAVVGSRQPTPSGTRTTRQLCGELGGLGLTITSGMALGIDSHAHRGCLDVGGKTIAVTACGIDVVYPRANGDLHREIADLGAVVSEHPPGAPPKREHFPRRNRIISGLALGTLVVEAGVQSGSLITARLAGEQGREVFAVPGSIHSPVSRGCHRLLRQGAKLVEGGNDILEEIGHFFTAGEAASGGKIANNDRDDADVNVAASLPANHARLFELIDFTPVAVDPLIAQSGLTADTVSYILTDLELRGLVAATAGGYQRLPRE